MPDWGSYSYAFGPVVVLIALIGIVFIMRWAFSGGSSLISVAQPNTPGDPQDYGLLTAVAAPSDYTRADALVAALAAVGIGATLANTTAGLRIMVFPEHAESARSVLRGLPT